MPAIWTCRPPSLFARRGWCRMNQSPVWLWPQYQPEKTLYSGSKRSLNIFSIKSLHIQVRLIFESKTNISNFTIWLKVTYRYFELNILNRTMLLFYVTAYAEKEAKFF